MDFVTSLLVGIIIASTPLVFAAVGELVVEKAGVLNLGVEGMMIIGAVTGFAVTVETGNHALGILAAALSGAAMGGIFAVMTQVLLSNQVATGLALTLFGLGLSTLIGQPYSGMSTGPIQHLDIAGLSDLPVVGPLVFGHDGLVYLSFGLVAAVAVFLGRSRAGLILRAVGDDHDAAHAIGHNVVAVRSLAILFGGASAGVGGAYLSVVQTPLWVEDMTAGRGWIALALVVFAAWRPWRALIGAYLFGGITILQLHVQGFGIAIEAQYLSMLPYLATIVVLVAMSRDRLRLRRSAPACLGKVFHAST